MLEYRPILDPHADTEADDTLYVLIAPRVPVVVRREPTPISVYDLDLDTLLDTPPCPSNT
jgi:hypothetical protein